MSFDIEGWIEVARNPDTADTHAWAGVVRLSSIVDVADEDTERVFGLSKQCVTGRKSVDTLAAGRGVPANPSAQVCRELEGIATYEAKYGPCAVGGYTYALWSEIKEYELVEQEVEPQLGPAFDLARVLEQRYGAERVRFVVWFCW